MVRFPSYLWLNNVPLCICIILLIHPSINGHLGYFQSWLVWTMLQWMWGCRYLFKLLILFCSDKHPEVEFGFYGSSVFNFLGKLHTILHSGCTSLYCYQQCKSLFYALTNTCYFSSLLIPILTGVKWFLCSFDLRFPDD